METIERDYTPQGVQFYYLYKQLAHPELDHYVDPYTMEERLMHVAQAERQLGSRIPWIADAMTNDLKHALGDMPNSEFIIGPDGRVLLRRAWSDPRALRGDLERLIGPVEHPTRLSDLDMPSGPPVATVAKGIVPRVTPPGRMMTVKMEPDLDSTDLPFYTKLRADVDREFLRTGEGTLLLGFHIDPLYHMHWNNLAPPLTYEVRAPDGVRVTPASATFAQIDEPADADPREFLVDIDADDSAASFDLKVTYYACDDDNTFCIPVTQSYAISLQVDPDAGRVFGAGRFGGRGGRGGPEEMSSASGAGTPTMTVSWLAVKFPNRCVTGSTGWTRTVTAYWKRTRSRACRRGWDRAAVGVVAAVVLVGVAGAARRATRSPGSARSTPTATGGSRVRRSPNRPEGCSTAWTPTATT